MMARRLAEDARAVDHAAALGVLGSETQRLEPGEADRGGAHRARLERHPDRAFVEPGGAEPGGGGPDRLHFGMRGRVGRTAHRVAGLGDDLIDQGDDRADRDFARGGRLCRKVERAPHRWRKRESHARAG